MNYSDIDAVVARAAVTAVVSAYAACDPQKSAYSQELIVANKLIAALIARVEYSPTAVVEHIKEICKVLPSDMAAMVQEYSRKCL